MGGEHIGTFPAPKRSPGLAIFQYVWGDRMIEPRMDIPEFSRRRGEHARRSFVPRGIARKWEERPGINPIEILVVAGIIVALTTISIPAGW